MTDTDLNPREGADSADSDGPGFTMYTTGWCGFCARLKRGLHAEDIDFTEIDIERVEGAAEIVMANNGGNRTVPTLIFTDGSALTNPSVAQVKAQLTRR